MPNLIHQSENFLKYKAIRDAAFELGVDSFGAARADIVADAGRFVQWLANGHAGEMQYLSRNTELRIDPRRLLPEAKSIIVIGLNYYPTPDDAEKMSGPFKVARYAWGDDYHNTLRRILKKLRSHLKTMEPSLAGRICVDTAPFMDKYWAKMAGLGWTGKHSNLVSREFGSWLLLGSLVINCEIDSYDSPGLDHCGQCHACLDSCPTGALFAPYQLDATRCISYWTIESKADEIPPPIATKLDQWIFGCDICLSVCPFNKFQKPRLNGAFQRRDEISQLESGQAMNLSTDEFEDKFGGSPIKRPGAEGIRRNCKAAVGDIKKGDI